MQSVHVEECVQRSCFVVNKHSENLFREGWEWEHMLYINNQTLKSNHHQSKKGVIYIFVQSQRLLFNPETFDLIKHGFHRRVTRISRLRNYAMTEHSTPDSACKKH